MRTTIRIPGLAARLAALLATLTAGAGAQAAPALRVQVDQRGDFLLIGNTLGYDCATGTPLPVVGTLAPDACAQTAANISDSSPDVYWSADAPTTGQCLADTATPATAARSTAILTVPVGATVTQAFLYWSATNTTGVADPSVILDRVGAGGFGPTTIAAIQSWTSTDKTYQSVADVTSIVQANGSGAYRVSDIDVAPFANVDVSVLYGGWWLVAFYQLPTDPLRNLALFDGLDVVSATGGNQSVTLSGFLVPNAGFTGKLGVVAFEGDNTATGDALQFNGVTLSNAQNPADNFFNSTRSWLGLPVSTVGDLPQLTGTAQSMGGVDIDVVDITAELTMGQKSAPISATTAVPVGDTYYLGGFITSISTFAQDFTTSTKTATDLNGGLLVPGDTLRYTITATNTGNDSSAQTVVTDPLPMGVTFVPGSIKVLTGDNIGTKTDATGDDQGEYVAATRTVTVRLGKNANGTMGGSIPSLGSSSFSFDVTVDTGTLGMISNQASISAGGTLGAPVVVVNTDGNGAAAGAPPTVVTVSQCMMDSDCGGVMSGVVCDPTDNCIPGCRGTGGNGCPTGMMCSSTTNMIGTCGPLATTASSAASTAASTSSTGGASTTASSSASTGGAPTTSSTGGAGGMGGAPTTTTASSGGAGGVGGGGGFIAVGNGVACNASTGSGSSDGAGWIAGVALAALAGGRRRRRHA